MSIWKGTSVGFGFCFEKKGKKKKAYLNSVYKPLFREENLYLEREEKSHGESYLHVFSVHHFVYKFAKQQ